jgi:plasmid stabilization system protein ParE
MDEQSRKLLAEYLTHNDHTQEAKRQQADLERVVKDLGRTTDDLAVMVQTGQANPNLIEQVALLEDTLTDLREQVERDREYVNEMETEGKVLGQAFSRAAGGRK